MDRRNCVIGPSCLESCPNLAGARELGLESLDVVDAAREAARMPVAMCSAPTEFEQVRGVGKDSLPPRLSCNLDPRVQTGMRVAPLIAGMIQRL